MAGSERGQHARIGRRGFLAAGAGAVAYGMASRASAAEVPATTPASTGEPGLIVREAQPENFESNFAALDGFLTPNERFYVRSHFPRPDLDAAAWRLTVEGAVERPLELSFDEFKRLASETKPVTLECAGNGRVLLVPPVAGAQWQNGAVSNAEWTGVPLAALLAHAGVKPGAVDVVLEGTDSGELGKPSKPAGPMHYARGLPLDRATAGGVLLAHTMNGQPLPASHGFPVRAVVPGWYGMASVKWLKRIVVTDRPFHGFFQTVDYAYWTHADGLPTRVPLGEMQVKSQIARPSFGEIVPVGGVYRVHGAAWTGDAEIAKVEVSVDGGRSFAPAKLLGDAVRGAWRLWEFAWSVPTKPGRHELVARATDTAGRTQPLARDKDRETYMVNHLIPTPVEVR